MKRARKDFEARERLYDKELEKCDKAVAKARATGVGPQTAVEYFSFEHWLARQKEEQRKKDKLKEYACLALFCTVM
jgi:hypothetical protein